MITKSSHPFSEGRRICMKALLALLMPQWAACSEQNRQPVIVTEDDALRHKFRGIFGGELRVDAMVPVKAAALYMSNGEVYHGLMGNYAPGGGDSLGFGGYGDRDRLVVPKTLRMMIYDDNASMDSSSQLPPFAAYNRWVLPDGSSPPAGMSMGVQVPALAIHDVTVPIAGRFPDALLDRARKYKGSSIRLKLRLMPETLLLGWEVRPGQSYPFPVDQSGNYYATDEDLMVGGDFREAKIDNGIAVRKGWYIHPKTGQRIETDF